MEATYKRLVGPINVKKPREAFSLQLLLLKGVGLWAPDIANQWIQALYTLYSFLFKLFFLYTYTASQILFFMQIEDLRDVAEGFFLLLTQITLLYKVEKFYINRHRIKVLMKVLESSLFSPGNEEEAVFIQEAMLQTLIFGLAFLVPAVITISSWAVLPFLEEKLRLPIAARYPFDTDKPWVFATVYFYQIFGIQISAFYNVSTDTFGSAIISHANAQVRRLGHQWSMVGYEKQDDSQIYGSKVRTIDSQMADINTKVAFLKSKHGNNENYSRVSLCVIFHENILRFTNEIQDIFKGPIFAQFMASCLIICMTLFRMLGQLNDIGALMSSTIYLMTMVTQVLLFCWIGNELIYSSAQLSEQSYFSNFSEFDRPTAKVMLLFMERTRKEIALKAGGLFEVILSLSTFMAILKSSYSYFALMQSMQQG